MGTWRDMLSIGDKVICRTMEEAVIPCANKCEELVVRYYVYSLGSVFEVENQVVHVNIEKSAALKAEFPSEAIFYKNNGNIKITSAYRRDSWRRPEKYDIEKYSRILKYSLEKWEKCKAENEQWMMELDDITEITPLDIHKIIQQAK